MKDNFFSHQCKTPQKMLSIKRKNSITTCQ